MLAGGRNAIAGVVRNVGVDEEFARRLAQYVAGHGGLLEELEVPSHVCDLVSRLRNQTWFRRTADVQHIATKRGTRQGCRFGSLMFNAVSGVALPEVLGNSKAEGIHFGFL